MKSKLGISGKFTCTFRDAETGKVIKESRYRNLTVQGGLDMIAERLAGDARDCNITHGAVGTNSTKPAIGDTTLGTEITRKTNSTTASSGSQILITVFFGAPEANGILTEFGLFGEAATLAVDSGTMFNHAIISETKTASETLTFSVTITIA